LTSQATQAKTDQELFSIIKNGGGVEMPGKGRFYSLLSISGLTHLNRGGKQVGWYKSGEKNAREERNLTQSRPGRRAG
jgi:hypothetical protein